MRTEHARFVYDLQKDSDQSDTEPEDADDDIEKPTTNSSARRTSRRIRNNGHQKRMSILSSRYFDVPRLPPEFERDLDLGGGAEGDPCGHPYGHAHAHGKKRRFFQSVAEWDPVARIVAERKRAGVSPGLGMGIGVVGMDGFDAHYMRVPVHDVGSEDRDGMDIDPDGDEDEE